MSPCTFSQLIVPGEIQLVTQSDPADQRAKTSVSKDKVQPAYWQRPQFGLWASGLQVDVSLKRMIGTIFCPWEIA